MGKNIRNWEEWDEVEEELETEGQETIDISSIWLWQKITSFIRTFLN